MILKTAPSQITPYILSTAQYCCCLHLIINLSQNEYLDEASYIIISSEALCPLQ